MSRDSHRSIFGKGFQHPAIDAACQVRLLRLDLMASTADNVRTTFHVTSIKLLKHTPYRALSYTWGSCSGVHVFKTIEIDGQIFQVRENLHDFLSSTIQRGECGLFFIDAICINQLDNDEKLKQIVQMEKVYRHAVQVVAWLGALDFRQYANVKALHESISRGRQTWKQAAWDGLDFLSHISYWGRMWVVQEVVLAASLDVWSGPFNFPVGLFETSSYQMPVLKLGFSSNGSPNAPLTAAARYQSPAQVIVTHNIRHVLRPVRRPEWDQTYAMTEDEIQHTLRKPKTSVQRYRSVLPDPLWQAMRKFGRQECSDPMDKLYGLLGILHEQTRAKIRPDYRRGVAFAFYQALRVGLEELYPNDEPIFSDLFRDPGRSYISYYSDARNAFSLDDEVAMPILREVCKELDFYRRGQNALLEVHLNGTVGWNSLDIQHHREFERAIMNITQDDEMESNSSPLFYFHLWQKHKLEKLLVCPYSNNVDVLTVRVGLSEVDSSSGINGRGHITKCEIYQKPTEVAEYDGLLR